MYFVFFNEDKKAKPRTIPRVAFRPLAVAGDTTHTLHLKIPQNDKKINKVCKNT